MTGSFLMLPSRLVRDRTKALSDAYLSYSRASWKDFRNPSNRRIADQARERYERLLAHSAPVLVGVEIPAERDDYLGNFQGLRKAVEALEEAGLDFRAEAIAWAQGEADKRRKAKNARRRRTRARQSGARP